MTYFCLVLLFVSACHCQVDLSERLRYFNIQLLYYTQLETDGHVMISPFGIWTLMTSIALGASGDSYRQLSRALILPDRNISLIEDYRDLTGVVLQSNIEVSLTNKNFVFIHNGFSIYPTFRSTIQNDFGASLKVLDFDDPKSVDVANNFIEKSEGRGINVLRSDDFVGSKMIISNVINFKGLWKSPFNESDTRVEPFYDESKNNIGLVNMMFQTGQFAFSNIQALKSYVIELPYSTDGKYSMLIFLAYPTVKIADMYKRIADVSFIDIFKRLKDDEVAYGMDDIDVKLPRFRIRTNVVLNKPFLNMGMYDIFQPNLANFSHVTKDSIFVSAIIHVADIEVTESGTVATETTTETKLSFLTPVPLLHINRPFMYFIMEKTTTSVLFSGIYSKPSIY